MSLVPRLQKLANLNEGVTFFPHQMRAIEKFLNEPSDEELAQKKMKREQLKKNLILAHEVGSGKTITSIAAFEKKKMKGQAKKALVVAPASLRNNFAEEGIGRFTDSKYNILGNQQEIAKGTHKSLDDIDKDADYYIVSYEMFRKDPAKYIQTTGADTVIFDELHRSKDDQTITYDAIRNSRNLYPNAMGLTGSIVSNRPHDVVPLINAFTEGQNALGSIDQFDKRYVIRKPVKGKSERKWPIIGLRHPQQLSQELKRYIDYVGEEDLPAGNKPRKVVHPVPVEMNKEQAKVYRAIMKSDKRMAAKLKNLEDLSDDEVKKLYNKLIGARRVGNSMASFKNIGLEESARTTPKIRRIMDDVERHLAETPDGQAIIYSNLINGGVDVLESGLKSRNLPYGKFIGKGNEGVTEAGRQRDVVEYNKGKKRVMLISAAGGEGLNLKDTTGIFSADPHFNPEKIKQVEARGIRTGGQSRRKPEDRRVDVNRYVATLPDRGFWIFKKKEPSIDEQIYEIAARKARINKMLTNLLREEQSNA